MGTSISLKNTSDQSHFAYYYDDNGIERTISIAPGEIRTFEYGTLAVSTKRLISSRYFIRVADTDPLDVSPSPANAFGLAWGRDWSPNVSYVRGAVVPYNGILWMSKVDQRTSPAPAIGSSVWQLFSVQSAESVYGINLGGLSDGEVMFKTTVGDDAKWTAGFISDSNVSAISISKITGLSTAITGLLPKSGGTMTGVLTLSGTPVNPLEAATKGYVDAQALAGGQMTGYLTLNGPPLQANHAATKAFVESQFSAYLSLGGGTMTGLLSLSGAPVQDNHAATKAYVDARLLRTGGTMTGALILAGPPTAALHAATKAYVDSIGLGGGTMTGLLTLSGLPTAAYHAAPKVYVDSKALAGGTLTGLLSIGSLVPTDAGHLISKGYVDTQISDLVSDLDVEFGAKLSKSGGTMTGLLTLSGAPTDDLHAATKKFVEDATGTSGGVLLLAGGTMTGPIAGAHGLLPVAGGTMTGRIDLADLEDRPVDPQDIIDVSDATSGDVWMVLTDVTGIDETMVLAITGTTSYNGLRPVLEVDTDLVRVRVEAAFVANETGTATPIVAGLYRSTTQDDIVFEGRRLLSQGRTVSISTEYTVVPGDGMVLADSTAAIVYIKLGEPDEFPAGLITIKKVNRNYFSPVVVRTASGGKRAEFSLKLLGESITLAPVNGQWEVIWHFKPSDADFSVRFDGFILSSPSYCEVDASILLRGFTSLEVTGVTNLGGSPNKIALSVATAADAAKFTVGDTITVERSFVGYNGTYTITAISGSAIHVARAFISTESGLFLMGNTTSGRVSTVVAKVADTQSQPFTDQLTGVVTNFQDAGAGSTWVVLRDGVADWYVGLGITVTSDGADYNGSYTVTEIDLDNDRLKITIPFVIDDIGTALSSSLLTMSVGATFGTVMSSATDSAAVRTLGNGKARVNITKTGQTDQFFPAFLHMLSGGDGNIYGTTELPVSNAFRYSTSITSVADAAGDGGGSWLVLNNISDWRIGDRVLVTGTTNYDTGEGSNPATWSVLEVDAGAFRIRISKVFVTSETGSAANMEATAIFVSDTAALTVGDLMTVLGVSVLGGTSVEKAISAIPTANTVTFRTPFVSGGSTTGLAVVTPVKKFYTVKPWSWYRQTASYDGSNFVSTWSDISGNARHMLNAAVPTTTKPIYNASAHVTANLGTRPALSLSAGRFATLTVTKAQPFTVIVVAKATSAIPVTSEFIFSGLGDAGYYLKRLSTDDYQVCAGGTAADTSANSPDVTLDTNINVYTVCFDGASSYLRKNGAFLLQGLSIGTSTLTALSVGDGAGVASMDGIIPEMIVLDGSPDIAHIQFVEQAMMHLYQN